MGVDTDSSPAVSPVIRRWQIGLIAIGLGGLAIGAVLMLTELKPGEIVGLAVWFLGALVIHDGIIAFAVFGIQLLLRRSGRRVPLAVLAILQGAVVICAIVALIVIPQIYKSAIGANNPTVVPLDYTANLVWFSVGMAIVTAIVVVVYLRVAPRRQKVRPSRVQD